MFDDRLTVEPNKWDEAVLDLPSLLKHRICTKPADDRIGINADYTAFLLMRRSRMRCACRPFGGLYEGYYFDKDQRAGSPLI